MKKSVAITSGVIIVAVGAWLGATWYTGKRIEAQTHQYLAQANDKLAAAVPGVGIRIEQDRYERGFFHSQARYTITFTTEKTEEDNKPLTIAVVSDIEHGPFPAGALKRGKWLPQLAFVHSQLDNNDVVKPFFDMAQGKPPLWSDTILSYDGKADGTGGVAALSFKDDRGAFHFSGATVHSVYDNHDQSVKGRIEADELKLDVVEDGDQVHARISGVGMDIDSHMGKFGLSVGTSALLVKTLEVSSPGLGSTLTLDNLGYALDISEDDTFVAGKAVYKVGKLAVGKDDFGGGELALSVAHLDGQTMKVFSDTYKQMVRGLMAGRGTDEGLRDEQIASLMENGGKLLAAKPSLAIDQLVWRNSAGESRFSLKLDLAKPQSEAGDDFIQSGAEFVQKAIKRIDANLLISKPMAIALTEQFLRLRGADAESAKQEAEENIQAVAGMAEMMNLGRNDGDNIVSKFNYADGRGELNGKEVPVKEWLADLANAGGDTMDDDDESPVVDELDAETVADIIDAAGYEYGYNEDKKIFTVLAEELSPTDITVALICAPDCDKLRLTAVYGDQPPPSAAVIKQWNAEYSSFGQASLNKRGKAMLQYEVDVSEGMSLDTIQMFLETFLAVADDFPQPPDDQ
ncbi:DUF945 family protein [Bordetella genomosp. 12]|uniref:DUF945 domain-containing protein n=1 Tax=Bordetella genomosp. 12 TaxID=463035 RepID=A0A261VC58_9BORD|nr:DUF945 family protein [Bordetella genomosp. 12]OZI71738.1 hypothetical protein CAL22_18245 [Bordetella genomosp. 12]